MLRAPLVFALTGIALIGWSSSALAVPTVSVQEDFSTDPIGGRATVAGDTGRFTYDGAGDQLTAAYDSEQPTSKLLWQLGRTVTHNWDFTVRGRFTIGSGLTADPKGFAQIAFGLLNSATTGADRTGDPNDAAADTYDLASVDYFPNESSSFKTLTLSPSVFESQQPGSTDAFDGFHFPQGSESVIEDSGEPGRLPESTPLRAELTYQAVARQVTLTLADVSGGSPTLLEINAVGANSTPGGPDGDPTTIQMSLPHDAGFALDRFGLLLWKDGYDDASFTTSGEPSVDADVTYQSFSVDGTKTIPEPAAIAPMLIGGAFLIGRRRRRAVR